MESEMTTVLVKLIIVPIFFSAAITYKFFVLLEKLGIKYEKRVKLQCFVEIAILICLFVMLARISLC